VSAEGAEDARSAGHSVVPLKEAHLTRVAKLQEQLAVTLFPKRLQLTELGSSLRRRMDEVSSARNAVERETTADCEGILERLRAAEGVKMASLTQNANEIDAELEAIDRIARSVDGSPGHGLTSGSGDSSVSSMLSLIQSYPELVRTVERVASRSLPQFPCHAASLEGGENYDGLTDFPRETKKRVDAVAREQKFEDALAVKDRMLWEVVQGHKKLEEQLKEEKSLCEEYSDEMGSWLELTDRLSKEVNQLRDFAAQTRSMEPEFEALLKERQEMRQQLEHLKLKEADYGEVIEENFALRQQLAHISLRMAGGRRGDDGGGEPSALMEGAGEE